MSDDPEFEDFLKRRRPLFRRELDDGLEPPAELDRIVLRQARAAIEDERPVRFFGMPRWAAPMAIAATLVLGLAVVFKAGVQPGDRIPEVRVENAAQRIDSEPAPMSAPEPAPMPAQTQAPGEPGGAIVVDLAPPMHAAPPAPPAQPMVARGEVSRSARSGAAMTTANPTPTAGEPLAWRRDAQAWQAEIQRLRGSGDQARADAEQAEFNRRYRTYAVSPDR